MESVNNPAIQSPGRLNFHGAAGKHSIIPGSFNVNPLDDIYHGKESENF